MDIYELASNALLHTVSLITIMNSLAAGAIMLSLLDKPSRDEIKVVAKKNTFANLIAMFITFFVGSYLFKLLGISTDSLMVFGGIILMLMGINMVSGATKKLSHTKVEGEEAKEMEDISTVPLSIPIIVGPGLATTLIALEATAETLEQYLASIVAIILANIVNWIILSNMNIIQKNIGINGIKVMSRIMGLIVGSIAVQMILKGALHLWQ